MQATCKKCRRLINLESQENWVTTEGVYTCVDGEPHIPSLYCPRCGHGIPNDYNIGEYIGALSRRDNKTYICSKCGESEAFEDMGWEKYDGPKYWEE